MAEAPRPTLCPTDLTRKFAEALAGGRNLDELARAAVERVFHDQRGKMSGYMAVVMNAKMLNHHHSMVGAAYGLRRLADPEYLNGLAEHFPALFIRAVESLHKIEESEREMMEKYLEEKNQKAEFDPKRLGVYIGSGANVFLGAEFESPDKRQHMHRVMEVIRFMKDQPLQRPEKAVRAVDVTITEEPSPPVEQ